MTMEECDELRLFLFGHGEEECSQEYSDGGGDAGDDHSQEAGLHQEEGDTSEQGHEDGCATEGQEYLLEVRSDGE